MTKKTFYFKESEKEKNVKLVKEQFKEKHKNKKNNEFTAADRNELLLQIARDLGYIE